MEESKLDALWPHIKTMTPEQIRERIREIRTSRRQPKVGTKKSARVASDKRVTKAKELSAGLSQEEINELLGKFNVK
jgi:hypothetical protein